MDRNTIYIVIFIINILLAIVQLLDKNGAGVAFSMGICIMIMIWNGWCINK
jgi:hypothetical protein